jgi:hypothetical protein
MAAAQQNMPKPMAKNNIPAGGTQRGLGIPNSNPF